MSHWTFKRGHWYGNDEEYDTPRTRLAKERIEKWDRQRRWVKFPQLGPIPEKWLDVGPAPTSPMTYINEVMIGHYLGPLTHWLNQPSPLRALLEKE